MSEGSKVPGSSLAHLSNITNSKDHSEWAGKMSYKQIGF